MSKLDEKKRSNSISSELEPSESKKSKIETDEQKNIIIKYIPMKNGSANVNKTFKTPSIESNSQNQALVNKSSKTIQQEIDEVDREIENLLSQGFKIEELDIIIEKLHVYNEIKDQTQCLLEKIAHIKGLTIRKIHELYGLDPYND